MQTKPDWLSHAATLLDDPLILDWALRYFMLTSRLCGMV